MAKYLIIIMAALVILIIVSVFVDSSKEEIGVPWVSGVRGPSAHINFPVYNKWGNKKNVFQDYGFDGTLNQVEIKSKEGKTYYLDPNSPNWDEQIRRYIETRDSICEPN